jgi:tagaturonate epimerase
MSSSLKELDRAGSYFVDTEHIRLKELDRFFNQCDAFTIDITDDIGTPPKARRGREVRWASCGTDRGNPYPWYREVLLGRQILRTQHCRKFIGAIQAAGEVYRAIASKKGKEEFIPEISMDKTDSPQAPIELLIVLAAIADERIPIQAIVPKLTGRLSRNTDYVRDVMQFAREFQDDTATIAFAVKQYDSPANLKLRVDSGSHVPSSPMALNPPHRHW